MAYLNKKKIFFGLKRVVADDIKLSSKKITKNGVHSASSDNLDGFSSVEVDVPIPEGYVKPEGVFPIIENGKTDVTNYAEVEVKVPIPEGYVKPEGTLPIAENGEKDVTNYAKVNVEIPEATSEVLIVTPNGEIQEHTPTDTDYYSKVIVEAIPPDYIQPTLQVKTVTENGEVTPDVGYDGLEKVIVDVPTSLVEIATTEEMNALLETSAVGSIYKYVGETTDDYENGVLYIVEEAE